MTTEFERGAKVEWNWANGTGVGTIAEIFTDDVTRTIKGARIKRKATPGKPAYLIEQEDGSRVLKSHSELTKA